ncbi:PREDICTED: uncharacterized protein LOC108361798 [Rhagoletis zephyria]|uniref:uncharacterized protein LOC108361798 n=1 Tax=Rhagoletis zephyria TaxID=28612 RepID=UPI0008112232|nr:PREDICTED: uncharacterized protein LOC108361798 [Rhagoletis zephyria]
MQCRACTKNKSQILVDMAVPCTDDGKCLFDYFNECTQLHASPKDSFPKTLCKMCAQKLQIAYNFRKCARQSEEFFHKFLIPNGAETEAIIFPPSDRLSLKEEVVVEPDFPGENICAENLIVETEEIETRLSPEAIETECVYAELLCEVSEYKLEKEALSESEEEDKDSNIENYQDTTTPESYFDATEDQCGDFYSSEFLAIEKVERQENAEDMKPTVENENELVCEQSNDISERLYLNESNDEKSLCNEEEEGSEDETLERITYLCEPQNTIDNNYSAKTFVGKRKKINESKQNGRKPMSGEAGQQTARANNKQQEVQKTNANKRTNIHNVKIKQKLLCSFCREYYL